MPYRSLESVNFEDRFIRHQNFLGELSQIQSDLDRHDATFQIGDGAGIGDLVRLRSLNFPLHVLRHQDFRVKLHEFNPPLFGPSPRPETPEERLLREDTSFFMIHGLADPSAVSFRSFNFPDRFLRHRDFHLFVEPVDSALGRSDATFHLRDPFVLPDPIVIH